MDPARDNRKVAKQVILDVCVRGIMDIQMLHRFLLPILINKLSTIFDFQILELRAEQAKMHGFNTFAEWVPPTANSMSRSKHTCLDRHP